MKRHYFGIERLVEQGNAKLTVSALIIALLMIPTWLAMADDDRSTFKQFVDGIGSMVFAVAWPTAGYERVSFKGFSDISGGTEVRFRVHGTSAWTGSDLWADVVVEVSNGSINDLRFGSHNAIVPPGATASALGELLSELTAEYRESSTAPSSLGSLGSGSSNQQQVVRKQIDRERGRLAESGYRESYDAVYNSLQDDSSGDVTLQLTGGRTYKIVGYCDQDCSDLDLRLLNSDYDVVDLDTAEDDYPKLSYTPTYSGEYRVRISMINCSVSPCRYGIGFFSRP